MTPKFLINYLSRCHKQLRDISRHTGNSCLYHWCDFLWCSIVHGAILNHYVRGKLYQYKGSERRRSLTYRRILRIFSKLNSPDSIKILNNKHLFNAHFSAFITRKWLYSPAMTFDQFNWLCDSCEALIIKPEDGVEGCGVRKMPPPSELAQRKELYAELTAGSFMVEECITQHPGMIFGNKSVNTIRAHTIMDKEGNVHISKMLLRAGVGESVVDNYAHGGCVYEIQPETGRVVSPSLRKDGQEVFTHPGTDIFMLGLKIPNWGKVCQGVCKAHALLPGCRFVGWDLAIIPNGVELIEGNHNPDYELYEFFGTKGWYKQIKKYI